MIAPSRATGEAPTPSPGPDGRRSPCLWIAVALGCGYSPLAPGTVGTLAALPLHWLLSPLGLPLHLVVVVAIALVGLHCSHRVAEHMQIADPQVVVIDEVAGVLVALLLAAPSNPLGWVLAVGLFRVFDIFKPWPIYLFERLPHRGGAIMADDLAAGLAAGLFAAAILWLAG